jgi:hypothetical protein
MTGVMNGRIAMRGLCAWTALFVVMFVGVARGEDAKSQLDANFKYLKDRTNANEDLIVKLLGQVAELERNKAGDNKALEQLGQLRADLEKEREEVRGLGEAARRLKEDAEGRGKKTEAEIDAIGEQVRGLVEQVNRAGKAAERRGDQVDAFKFQTRMKVRQRGREYSVELERVDGGKVVPLGGKRVEVLEQFKDGEPTPTETIVTDDRGIAAGERRHTTRDDPKGLSLVFRFAGDETHRGTSTRIRLK